MEETINPETTDVTINPETTDVTTTPVKQKSIYWEGENLIVYDDRRKIKYVLEEINKRALDKIKNATTPKSHDPRENKVMVPNMDLYIDKLIATSVIEPKLTDTDIGNLPGKTSMLLQKAVMRLYGMDEEILEDF